MTHQELSFLQVVNEALYADGMELEMNEWLALDLYVDLVLAAEEEVAMKNDIPEDDGKQYCPICERRHA